MSTSKSETDSDEQYVVINEQEGFFNLADPHEKQLKIKVKIPAHDFDHEFVFDPNKFNGLENDWVEDLYEISLSTANRNISDKSAQEELEEIVDKNADRIKKEWIKQEIDRIDRKQEKLEKRREKLSRKLS